MVKGETGRGLAVHGLVGEGAAFLVSGNETALGAFHVCFTFSAKASQVLGQEKTLDANDPIPLEIRAQTLGIHPCLNTGPMFRNQHFPLFRQVTVKLISASSMAGCGHGCGGYGDQGKC
jgi:hypothetical protein